MAQEWKEVVTYNKTSGGANYINASFAQMGENLEDQSAFLVSITGSGDNVTAITNRLALTSEGGLGENNIYTNDAATGHYHGNGQGENSELLSHVPKILFASDNGVFDSTIKLDSMATYTGGEYDFGPLSNPATLVQRGNASGNGFQLTEFSDLFPSDGTWETPGHIGYHRHIGQYLSNNGGILDPVDIDSEGVIAGLHPDAGDFEIEVINYSGGSNTMLLRLPNIPIFYNGALVDKTSDGSASDTEYSFESIIVADNDGSNDVEQSLCVTRGIVKAWIGRLLEINTNVTSYEFPAAAADSYVKIKQIRQYAHQTVSGSIVPTEGEEFDMTSWGVRLDTGTIDSYPTGTGYTTVADLSQTGTTKEFGNPGDASTLSTNSVEISIDMSAETGNPTTDENKWRFEAGTYLRMLQVAPNGTSTHVRAMLSSGADMENTTLALQSGGAISTTSVPLGSTATGQVSVNTDQGNVASATGVYILVDSLAGGSSGG